MGFARRVVFTYAVRFLLIPVGLGISVVNARWLGAESLGLFATIGAVLGLAAQVGNLGISVAATRYVAEDPRRCRGLVSNARWTGLVLGLVAIGALAGLHALAPTMFGALPLSLLMIAAIALPFGFAGTQFQALLLGLERVRAFNLMEGANRVALLAGTVLVLVVLGLGLRELVILTAVLALLQFVVYHAFFGLDAGQLAPDLPLLRRMARFSGRVYVGNLLQFLVLRVDLLLLNALRGPAEAGVYSIAVRPSDFLMMMPAIAGALLVPRVASGRDARSEHFTALVCRHTAALIGLALVGLGGTAYWLVPLLWGGEYAGAVPALWILLPGVFAIALLGILANDLIGRDYPLEIVRHWSIACVLNLGLNAWWIPEHGLIGAALASTIAYVLAFTLVARTWLRRFPGIGWRRLVMLDRDDLRALRGRLMRVWRPESEK